MDSYEIAQAHGCLCKVSADAESTYGLVGRLYASKSGWVLLSVPNAVARGLYDALGETGIELPPGPGGKPFSAHISVMRPEEVERIGGIGAISERGHQFHWQMGPVKTVVPAGWPDISRVWFCSVASNELKQLRRSYGLPSLPTKNGKEIPLHLTFAVRKKKVMQENEISKASEVSITEWDDDDDPKQPLHRFDAHMDGVNVGYLTSHPATEGGIWLKGLKVKPKFRGQGVGKSLLQHAVNAYKDQELRLRARPYAGKPMSMEQLQALYRRYGFEPYDDEGRMVRKQADEYAEYWEGMDKEAEDDCLLKYADYALGLPDKSDMGDIDKVQAGQVLDFVRQKHTAERAGLHEDIRFGNKDMGLFSWVTRKGLPPPGGKHMLFRQPVHRYEYKDFEGEIPSGYGKGTVKREEAGQVQITKVSPKGIHFATTHRATPEKFVLVRPRQGNKNWLLVNATPKAAPLVTLEELKKAKQLSDVRNYAAKHQLLRDLIKRKRDDWNIGEDQGMGSVQHKRTGFRYHLPQRVIPA